MDKLKERSTSNTSHGPAPVSKFVLLCAHLWICTTTARDVNLNSDTSLLFAMDVRSRLDPPMVEGYFGNCIRPCIVKAKAVELMGEDGFIFAVTTIKNAISVFSNEPLKECIDWADLYMTLPSELLCVGGSPRFKIYEADFGWGRPSRVEPASMSREGVVILSDARESGARQGILPTSLCGKCPKREGSIFKQITLENRAVCNAPMPLFLLLGVGLWDFKSFGSIAICVKCCELSLASATFLRLCLSHCALVHSSILAFLVEANDNATKSCMSVPPPVSSYPT
ncbi:hypothetical protein IFM89_018968 [Coptis chinensis]|uniref:Uncharacterized protein n=1 Tax=Coptis chinensis TaxID=261450 RepID=A0A835I623_9MAGN|nr:hypothetical protein IFM89_018968 [Coptis chinensis]